MVKKVFAIVLKEYFQKLMIQILDLEVDFKDIRGKTEKLLQKTLFQSETGKFRKLKTLLNKIIATEENVLNILWAIEKVCKKAQQVAKIAGDNKREAEVKQILENVAKFELQYSRFAQLERDFLSPTWRTARLDTSLRDILAQVFSPVIGPLLTIGSKDSDFRANAGFIDVALTRYEKAVEQSADLSKCEKEIMDAVPQIRQIVIFFKKVVEKAEVLKEDSEKVVKDIDLYIDV